MQWKMFFLWASQFVQSFDCSDGRKGCYFHTRCLLLDCIDSPRRGSGSCCSLSSDRTEVSNRWPMGQRKLISFNILPDIFCFFEFDINSQRSSDGSSTRVVDPTGRGTCFTEAITPSANVSESSFSAVTITYIAEQPVHRKPPRPSRPELFGRRLLMHVHIHRRYKSIVLLHGKALKYNKPQIIGRKTNPNCSADFS